jgi:hypothetical protein
MIHKEVGISKDSDGYSLSAELHAKSCPHCQLSGPAIEVHFASAIVQRSTFIQYYVIMRQYSFIMNWAF